jgi:peptidoglycan/LPS O-acetylase OafA/YrhL
MQRSRALDCLRAVAIVLVLGRHLDLENCPADGIVRSALETWYRGGWTGVDLFFVLSGFLVSGLLFREHMKHGSISYKHFFIRRGLKIYPSFYVLLVVTSAVIFYQTGRPGAKVLLVEGLFLQNYLHNHWSHTWSLAVEEHFYLLLPMLLIFVCRTNDAKRVRLQRVPWIFAALAVICLLLRLLISWREPYNFRTHQSQTHLRLDSLFFGVVLSYLFHYHPGLVVRLKPYRIVLLLLGVMTISPAFIFPVERTPFIPTYGLTALYLGFGMILLALVMEPALETRFFGGIAQVGARSYSIYLWHLPLAQWGVPLVIHFFGGFGNWWVYACFYLAGSVAVGFGMSELMEYPVIHLRDRVFPSRSNLRVPLQPS